MREGKGMDLRQLKTNLAEIIRMPKVSVNLDLAACAGNQPFFREAVLDFYRSSQKRHPKFPLLRANRFGVAVCRLPSDFDSYFMLIEAAARRNYKKAQRLGYEFARIDYNQFLADVAAIRGSAEVRQGPMPEEYLSGQVSRVDNPPSRNNRQDYPFFGVLRGGRLLAYAGCLITGEVCFLEHIFGHADYQKDGVVPLLIIEIARTLYAEYPGVKYYVYGGWFGAQRTMQRFKRKFNFLPHRVDWILGEDAEA